MLSPSLVCQQINAFVLCLVKIGLSSDQNISFVRKHSRRMAEVSFDGAEYLSIALKNLSYSEIYNHLESKRAYVTKLTDGSVILMRYNYLQGDLLQHSLGFYPSPSLEDFQNNPDVYLEEAVYADVVAKNIVPFPIRFDFDCRVDSVKPVKHPKSHLTLGQYENCRIPVTCPLTPGNFFSFILRHFYNTAFLEYCELLPKFTDWFDDSIHPEEQCIMHVTVPQSR